MIETNIINGESRTEAFLKKNANGKTPTFEINDTTYLAESTAILYYLAVGTNYFPTDNKLHQAQILQWMSFEQYSHEPYIATSRFWISLLKQPAMYAKQILDKKPGGYVALDVMEAHLSRHHFFVNETYSIADIALYAYTHVANEGGFDLSLYPSINRWLQRVADQAGHISIIEPYNNG
ncbi:MAG: glutathione S-transferase [Candidatus Azotimanducaceae bacterium]|jgi:glutathione S-transferase